MKKFLKLRSEIFGLDINDLSLKIVKLKKKNGSFVLTSFNKAEISPGIIEGGIIRDENALAEIIKTACKSVKGEKLDTKDVIVSLPEEKSFLQVIQMPKMDEKELKSAALFEVENYIPLSINDIYVDFQGILSDKSQSSRSDVLIVAMPKQIVDSYVSCIEKAGLLPIIFEVESQAIARALIKKEEKDAPPLAIIDFGKNNTNLIIYFKNSIRFTCSINVCSQQITEAISKFFQISIEEAEEEKIKNGLSATDSNPKILEAATPVLEELSAQIKKYLDFYSEHFFHERILTDGKVEKIILCGGGSDLKGLSDFIFQKLNIPVETPNLLENILVKNIDFNNPLSFTAALGLAERGVIEGKEYPHI